MPDGLYDSDILAWSGKQAELLRRLARGERVNEAVDWDHVIEEVEDVGRAQLRAFESLLRQALIHLIKLSAEPRSEAADHWAGEAAGFVTGARSHFAPSMRQWIDLDEIYRDAIYRAFPRAGASIPLPERCALTLDDLIAVRPDIDALAAKLG